MKVTLRYEDNFDVTLHKILRITLPKSWKTGPTNKLLEQFIDSYNSSSLGELNKLIAEEMHLAVRSQTDNNNDTGNSVNRNSLPTYVMIASNAITMNVVNDRQDVYVRHGPSETVEEMEEKQNAIKKKADELMKRTVQCTRFGCRVRFDRGGPYPGPCVHHKSPPVFHETAKFWSCCSHKKAYDFEEFQQIPGCMTSDNCTDVKDSNNNNTNKSSFLGGMDLREQINGTSIKPLRSIEEFNKSLQQSQPNISLSLLDQLGTIFLELGIEKELYQQVIDGIRKQSTSTEESDIIHDVHKTLGCILKEKLKSVAAEQLRIK